MEVGGGSLKCLEGNVRFLLTSLAFRWKPALNGRAERHKDRKRAAQMIHKINIYHQALIYHGAEEDLLWAVSLCVCVCVWPRAGRGAGLAAMVLDCLARGSPPLCSRYPGAEAKVFWAAIQEQ